MKIAFVLLVVCSLPWNCCGFSLSPFELSRRDISSRSNIGDDQQSEYLTRRGTLQALTRWCPPAALVLSQFPVSTHASSDNKDGRSSPTGILSREQVAKLLNDVPTFTIVDQAGVPYMVVGEDAKVTAYFFVSYNEAARILKLASTSADQAIAEARRKGEAMDPDQQVNPWKKARISTVPMDTALSISLQSSGGALRSYFQVAATEADIEDALAVTGKDDLAEGKVPLFYYSEFQDSRGNSPLFFSKVQLEEVFRQSRSRSEPLPQVQVTELLSVVRLMVQPGGDESTASLVFVPPADSAKRSKDCIRKGGSDPPLVMGKRNIVL